MPKQEGLETLGQCSAPTPALRDRSTLHPPSFPSSHQLHHAIDTQPSLSKDLLNGVNNAVKGYL